MTAINELEKVKLTKPEGEGPKVYPLGFLPEIKHAIINYSAQRWEENKQELTAIGSALKQNIEILQTGRLNLDEFLGQSRALDQFIQDGEAASQTERDILTHILMTDEELAVICAKVSRSAGSLTEIAGSVSEEGAADFHQKWTVSVEGYGHASVAEHSIIHMAVEDVPSLDGDVVTDNRPGTFTEFSARFKGVQTKKWYTPPSVEHDSILNTKWQENHTFVFDINKQLQDKALEYLQTEEAKQRQPDRKPVLKTAADQFKDMMPGSRLTSIALTLNAREAEHAIRKMVSSPYPSVRELGKCLKEQSLRVSPTLVKYAEPNEYMIATRQGIKHLVDEQKAKGYTPEFIQNKDLVDLISYDSRADDKFIAAAMYRDPRSGTYRQLLDHLAILTPQEKKGMVQNLLDKLGTHDVPLRALEIPDDYLVDFTGMTYGNLREYKRHRIQSYEPKDPDIRWGYMLPPLALEMDQSQDIQFHGTVDLVRKGIEAMEELYELIKPIDPYAANYAVTRFHFRPTLAKFNPREMFHLMKLRTSLQAHDFIRNLMFHLFDKIEPMQPVLAEHMSYRMGKRISLW